MENNTNKIMSILSTIGTLIIGAVEVISAIYNLSLLSGIGYVERDLTIIAIACSLDLILGIFVAALACMTFMEKYRYQKRISVIILVILSILLVFQIVGMMVNFSGLQIVSFILILFPLITKSIETFLIFNENNEKDNINDSLKEKTVEEKIAEMKRLKDLEFLSDEQYSQAINKILENMK